MHKYGAYASKTWEKSWQGIMLRDRNNKKTITRVGDQLNVVTLEDQLVLLGCRYGTVHTWVRRGVWNSSHHVNCNSLYITVIWQLNIKTEVNTQCIWTTEFAIMCRIRGKKKKWWYFNKKWIYRDNNFLKKGRKEQFSWFCHHRLSTNTAAVLFN